MPKLLDNFDFPEDNRSSRSKKLGGLRIPQVRVLRVLRSARGPMSRASIVEAIGLRDGTIVMRALGMLDCEARTRFETQSKDGGYITLISHRYVKAVEIDLDGLKEICYMITDKGIAAIDALSHVKLPALRNSYQSG